MFEKMLLHASYGNDGYPLPEILQYIVHIYLISAVLVDV